MKKFISKEKHKLREKEGWLFVVENDAFRDKSKPNWANDILYNLVEIDEKQYLCTGIESYSKTTINEFELIGLLTE